ncbi:MAG: decaprenyl-phosphate phosphoribosyltransferase [Chlorobiota bacterium]|nr:decaprenyl-phosphate phosphoribosyltransferase [Chlorobiota bacterium]QQS67499.1 MAG: decaprenyl-phosphate phosphoribosyltransferase [Chlorobiota bacterium]
MMLNQLFKLIRPTHWIKNAFVFAALVYSKELSQSNLIFQSVLTFITFCFVSSSIYILNDIRDKDSDSLHPVKKTRPIASGRISIKNALFLLSILLTIATLILYFIPFNAVVFILIYAGINTAYSFGLKNVVLLDIFIIAGGFMLRMLAGAAAISVEVSSWLIICTLFISLFLAIMKRRGELRKSYKGNETRKVLKDYSEELIRIVLSTSVAGSIMSYTLYTVSEHTIEYFHSNKMILTVPIVMYGIFRYIYIDEKLQNSEDTVNAILQDKGLLICGLVWIISTLVIIYG